MTNSISQGNERFWLAVPMALYAVGLLCQNAYLARYNLADFSLLQARHIFTGAATVFFLGLCIVGLLWNSNLEKASENLAPCALLRFGSRAAALAVVTTVLLRVDVKIVQGDLAVGLGENAAANWSSSVFEIAMVLLVFWTLIPTRFERFSSLTQLVFGPTLWVVIFLFSRTNPVLADVCRFFLLLCFCAVFGFAGFADGQEGIHVWPFVHSSSEQVPLVHRWLSHWKVSWLAVNGVLLVSFYATYFYPWLSRAWGGGRPVPAVVRTQAGESHGLLLDEGEVWISLLDEKEVRRFRVDTVEEILTECK